MADFKGRVEGYAELHKQLAKGDAKQEKNSTPTQINDAKAALAAKVKAARAGAETGGHLHLGDPSRLPAVGRARAEG